MKNLKGKNSPNWKGGITKSNCIVCGKIIKNSKKCHECYTKERNEYPSSNPNWKGGIRRKKGYNKIFLKEWRHRKGISKNYNSRTTGIKSSKKLNNQAYKRRVRIGGKLTIQTIQQIYEDNIKQYSTLTCYLCLKSILFGKDCLEHKIPLSRGGTNIKSNLAIAHRSCNSRKQNKTEKEFREEEILL